MLRIYTVSLDVAHQAVRFIKTISTNDKNLADQLRRAVTSVPLNLAEGSGSRGGNRRQRYLTALGSAREVVACIEVGRAMGYVQDIDDTAIRGNLDQVIGTLVRICR